MVCCCDPLESLGPEEMQPTAEMDKNLPAEKTPENPKPAAVAGTGTEVGQKDKAGEQTIEMEELLVSVVLPHGVYPGQKIEVRSPDGSRTVETAIPAGLHPGQAFLVKFPPIPKKTLKLQGSLATVGEIYREEQEREDIEPERGDGERDDTAEQTDHSPSFMQVLDDFLTPKPDPDVIEAMEKAKKEAEEKELSKKTKTKPTPENGFGNLREKACQDLPIVTTVNTGENSLCDQSVTKIMSSHIKKVAGEAVQATVTRVAAEPIFESRQMEPEEHKKDHVAVRDDEIQTSTSFVKTLEDFFTPKPEVQNRQATMQGGDLYPPAIQTTLNQKLVLVHVPPELRPGTTIYVEIPGESRTVAAQVPPNVTSFHVAYTPQPTVPQIRAPPTMARADVVARQPQVGKEKLLSVRVPPGTLPGTTLHISVPDEPGRILAAQVPPGNVKKFHVSYIPREPSMSSGGGMLPPANPYQQALSHFASYYAPQQI